MEFQTPHICFSVLYVARGARRDCPEQVRAVYRPIEHSICSKGHTSTAVFVVFPCPEQDSGSSRQSLRLTTSSMSSSSFSSIQPCECMSLRLSASLSKNCFTLSNFVVAKQKQQSVEKATRPRILALYIMGRVAFQKSDQRFS